ncbi:E3 ubiquitin-protein ligase TRIM56-like [Gigantopelta aegis]|uniref:E3 ubiquitin-protein ligase TRIM56-like n=1 Tax=Gigantopelta aegis TaxID=1735272 RepID=UPI001B88D7CC|nr:E3 ubiquitin-protein ligase TRIM56-like [Gigantopelta aegis]
MEEHCEVVPRPFLCCRLCGDEFQQPKMLPCLHSFCKTCIEGYVDSNKDEDSYFACPVCGTETTIQEEHAEKLPDNMFARRLSNPVVHVPVSRRDRQLQSCRTCQQNGSRAEADMHCINCDDFLCTTCSESHQLEVETASHKMLSIKEEGEPKSTGSSTPTDPDILPRCCEYYDPYDIGSMFCVDCNMTLCSECHPKDHNDHRCAELSAVADNFENKIKVPISELAHDAETLNASLSDLQMSRNIINGEQSELRKTVHSRTKFLCKMIKEYESFVLEEIDKRYNNYLQNIEEQECEINLRLESIQAVTDFTEKLVSFGSSEEKVAMRHRIGRRVRELCEEELPMVQTEMTNHCLYQPDVNVETICDLFGELKAGKNSTRMNSRKTSAATSGLTSTSDSVDQNNTELTELEEYEDRDSDMLSASYASDPFRSSNTSDQMHLLASSNEPVEESSFQSSGQDDVPCQNLTTPQKELPLPVNIQRDCIKGVAINANGDIVIATVSNGINMIYYIEKRGIVRGQIQIEKGWTIHSVAADGKVALMIARGDNRYKVRVMSADGSGAILADVHLESFGLNYMTASSCCQVIVSSSRYTHRAHTKTSKSGGNIAIYNPDSQLVRRITNDDFIEQGLYLLEKPYTIYVDTKNNIFVTDSGSHLVCGFTQNGELLFEYGNTDHDEEIYQGPDAVCTDKQGNVIVTDRREGRIDVLDKHGHLLKCLYPEDNIKSVSVSLPENLLMVATVEGTIKFYEYL